MVKNQQSMFCFDFEHFQVIRNNDDNSKLNTYNTINARIRIRGRWPYEEHQRYELLYCMGFSKWSL